VEIHSSNIAIKDSPVIFSIIHDVTERIQAEKLLQFRQALESLISSISTYFIRPDHYELDMAITNALQSIGEFFNVDHSFILRFSDDLLTLGISHQWCKDNVTPINIPSGTPSEKFPHTSAILLKGEMFRLSSFDEIPQIVKKEADFYKKNSIKSSIIIPMISAGMVVGGIGFNTINDEKEWIDDTLTLLRMVGEIIVNTLIKKQTEDALRASEKKYRKFFEEDLTADYIAAANGQILFCNPAFARIFGFKSVNDALSYNLKDLDTPAGNLKNTIKNLKKNGDVESKEIELFRRDGEPVYIVGNFRGVFDDQGNLTESKGYLFDISEHKRTEEQFRGAQKMEAIGRLAGGVAHDFNNLLTVINGYSDLLLSSNKFIDVDKERVELIKKAGERAASLTGQLLAFSRKQIVQPQVINLNAIILEFEKMLYRLIGENIEIVNHLRPDLSKVEIDPTQLEQIIINLAVNARDAMPMGGKLYIRTDNVHLNRKFAREHRPIQPGDYVAVEVTDTGIGMDEETMSHVFEPFFTTKEKGKGTGLGLSTIYGIVKQSDGYVWIESKLNRGTSFYIYFPPVEGEPTDLGEDAKSSNDILNGEESILVVEDDAPVRELTGSFLQGFGYTVYLAADAESAFNIFDEHKQDIDLVIIDVIMPDMGGKQLSEKIINLNKDIKILFISGYTDNDIVKQGVLNKKIEFLQKPFTAVEIGKKIRKVLDYTKSRH